MRGIAPEVVHAELLWPDGALMSRLLVLTTPELAVGYRLAGAATVEVRSAAETRRDPRGTAGP